MTVGEAIRACDAFGEQRRDRAYFEYSNALAIGLFIGSMFSNSHNPPAIHDIFPELFDKDEEAEAVTNENASAANFLNFANKFNERFHNGNGKPESENNG